MSHRIPPSPRLLRERFPIQAPNGRTWQGALYRSATRVTGRRIVVSDRGNVLFDTDEQFDLANARHALDAWLGEQVKEMAR